MTLLRLGPTPTLREDVECIYNKYRDRISHGTLMMLSPDSGNSNYYVYEWFTKDSGKVFYVGKGTGNRYRHILTDMKRPRGKLYQELQDSFGIDYRFVVENLTSYESALYELCLILERFDEGEVLLQSANNPGQDVYWEQRQDMTSQCIARTFTPSIIVDPYHKKYFDIVPPQFDPVCEDGLSHVSLLASFSAGSPETTQEIEYLKNVLVSNGTKVFSTTAKSAKAVIEFDNMDYSKYLHYKERGLFVYHAFDVVKFL